MKHGGVVRFGGVHGSVIHGVWYIVVRYMLMWYIVVWYMVVVYMVVWCMVHLFVVVLLMATVIVPPHWNNKMSAP